MIGGHNFLKMNHITLYLFNLFYFLASAKGVAQPLLISRNE